MYICQSLTESTVTGVHAVGDTQRFFTSGHYNQNQHASLCTWLRLAGSRLVRQHALLSHCLQGCLILCRLLCLVQALLLFFSLQPKTCTCVCLIQTSQTTISSATCCASFRGPRLLFSLHSKTHMCVRACADKPDNNVLCSLLCLMQAPLLFFSLQSKTADIC